MGLPYTGGQMRRVTQPYSGAQVWGTGINPVHSFYGSPSARVRPGDFAETPASEGMSQQVDLFYGWEYQEPPTGTGYITYDDRPTWDTPSNEMAVRRSTLSHPPLDATGRLKALFRSQGGGAHRFAQVMQPTLPSETVSEGWTNKNRSGLADAKPSAPSQYEIQTSMRQRYETRNNRLAVERDTDEPREPIDSRTAGQKLKTYSTGERSYDMLPREQDEIPRPFYYRTAGVGNVADMAPNEMWDIGPIQRTVPPDPSLGSPETNYSQYGYTPEDTFYA